MKRSDSLRVALENLKANKIRSLLSMLGIVIGTGAVIVVTSLVNGTREATLRSLTAGSENVLRLSPTYSEQTQRFGKITVDDVERLKKIPYVESVLPDVSAEREIRGSVGKAKGKIVGVDADYADHLKYEIAGGRPLNPSDIQMRSRICLLTGGFARKIFGIYYPVGRRIRIDDTALEVVGLVKEPDGLSRLGKSGDVLAPTEMVFRILNSYDIYNVEIRAEKGRVDKVKEEIQTLIQSNPRQAGLLNLQDPREYLKEVKKWAGMWMLQMVLIAGISLLVGGVGLMNVMLTTVAERTHEIGLRKALGATTRKIQEQFLIESATLSGLGGLTGVLLGVFISLGLEVLSQGKIFVSIMPVSLVISFVFSLLLGVLFGLYPASKAARMSPVEALRYE